MISLDKAARCKSCDEPGAVIISQRLWSHKLNEPVDVAVYECPRTLCLNGGPDNRWIVQSDLNGVVYEREHGERGHDKEFPQRSEESRSKGRQVVEDALGYELEVESPEEQTDKD